MFIQLHNRRLLRTALCLATTLLVLQASLGPHVLHAVFGCLDVCDHAEGRDGGLEISRDEGHGGREDHPGVCLACTLAKSLLGAVRPDGHHIGLELRNRGARACCPPSSTSSRSIIPGGPRAPPALSSIAA